MSDYGDAKRWLGKTVLQSSTDPELKNQLEALHEDLDAAVTASNNRNHEEAAEIMEEMIDNVELLLETATWPQDGYDYADKMETESLPAMKNLLETFEEREEVKNL
jgi:hypothetical protein